MLKKCSIKLLFMFVISLIPFFGLFPLAAYASETSYMDTHSRDSQRYQTDCNDKEWLTLSANLDAAYRNTNFLKSGHNAAIFQWDGRFEFWMPPGKQNFSWGPYIRFAGLTSNNSQAWENAWLSQPGFGIHAFPFSGEKKSTIKEIFGPLRVFAEYNRMDYWGSENIWRPDEQVRAGADYWRADNVNDNDPNKHIWDEIWTGLTWQSANEFDTNYDTLILGNSVRLGYRDPNSEILSILSPYLVVESSLTENDEYYWENKLVAGVGIRFAPFLEKHPCKPNQLSRFVIFAEYLPVVAYYRHSAPSSVPDYDFRAGISISIGEWWR